MFRPVLMDSLFFGLAITQKKKFKKITKNQTNQPNKNNNNKNNNKKSNNYTYFTFRYHTFFVKDKMILHILATCSISPLLLIASQSSNLLYSSFSLPLCFQVFLSDNVGSSLLHTFRQPAVKYPTPFIPSTKATQICI